MNTDRSMLERWGRFVYRKRWYVLGVWVVVSSIL